MSEEIKIGTCVRWNGVNAERSGTVIQILPDDCYKVRLPNSNFIVIVHKDSIKI
jgi:hypothetical protein